MRSFTFEGKTYKISFSAMPESLQQKLSGKDLKQYLGLLEKVQTNPRNIYKQVKIFCSRYSDVPEIINLLTFAHIQNHRIVEAEKLIEQTYLEHPEYLFARINYADQCIRKRKFEKVHKIFPTFDLKQICPEKEIFHTSEFRGFLVMMTYYHLARKNKEKALHYFLMGKEIEPNHPSILYLEKKLFRKSLLNRLLNKFKKN